MRPDDESTNSDEAASDEAASDEAASDEAASDGGWDGVVLAGGEGSRQFTNCSGAGGEEKEDIRGGDDADGGQGSKLVAVEGGRKSEGGRGRLCQGAWTCGVLVCGWLVLKGLRSTNRGWAGSSPPLSPPLCDSRLELTCQSTRP
jgi:hypothetical protein